MFLTRIRFFFLAVAIFFSAHAHGISFEPIENILKGTSCEESLTAEQVSDLLRPDSEHPGHKSTAQFRLAMEFLKKIPNPTQLQLAMHWEKFARHIRESDPYQSWNMRRAFGPNGDIIYFGGSTQALIITKTPEILRGTIVFSDINGEQWNGTFYPPGTFPPLDLLDPAKTPR